MLRQIADLCAYKFQSLRRSLGKDSQDLKVMLGSARLSVPLTKRKSSYRMVAQVKTDLFRCSNVDEHIRNDVNWLKAHPLMRKGQGITIGGYLYDIKTGKLRQVV